MDRAVEELDYTLEADSQQQAAVGFANSEEFHVPLVLASTPISRRFTLDLKLT